MSTPGYRTKRVIQLGYLVTLPTILFWLTVFASRYLGFIHLADMFLFMGMISYIGITFFLPSIAIIIAIATRMKILEEESKTRIYSVETNNIKLNQRLINWCVFLYAILVIALLID